jgi:antitoxin component HigA of HigAB toxin-antitoxin module
MNIKSIRSDEDLQEAFRHLEGIFQAKEGIPEADEMEILVILIEAYESQHYPISPPDPVEAINFVKNCFYIDPTDLIENNTSLCFNSIQVLFMDSDMPPAISRFSISLLTICTNITIYRYLGKTCLQQLEILWLV